MRGDKGDRGLSGNPGKNLLFYLSIFEARIEKRNGETMKLFQKMIKINWNRQILSRYEWF